MRSDAIGKRFGTLKTDKGHGKSQHVFHSLRALVSPWKDKAVHQGRGTSV
jgi:hypothetical protein